MSVKRVRDAILSNIESFIKRSSLHDKIAKVRNRDDKLIVLNNTFFFRERTYIKTNKSDKYLAITGSESKLDEKGVYVITGPRFNTEYKLLSATDDSITTKTPLPEAVLGELEDLGSIVFVLIGQVNDAIVTNADISDDKFSELQVNPSQTQQQGCVKVL